MIKKVYLLASLYISNSRKMAIFFGFTTYREKIYRKKSLDDVTFTPRDQLIARRFTSASKIEPRVPPFRCFVLCGESQHSTAQHNTAQSTQTGLSTEHRVHRANSC